MFKRSLKALATRLHYIRRAKSAEVQRLKQLINQSNLFDAQWYLQRYPDVAKSALEPLDHFTLHGCAEGRSPGPLFDAQWYLRRHLDVARSGVSPLLHYLEHGRHEGRSIKALRTGRNEDGDIDRNKRLRPNVVSAPYTNDYDESWQAQALSWRQLGDCIANLEQPTSIEPPEPELLAKFAKGLDQTRIQMFLATVPGATQADVANWESLDPVLLGLDSLADGWFAHSQQLLLRVDGDVFSAYRIVAFQADFTGRICRVADQFTASSINLVQLDLENPLSPVLLAWLAPDGRVIRTALAMFPSLYRGGLHHTEMLAVSLSDQRPDAVASYMAELAGGLFGTQPLLLGLIRVNLQGANGTEYIFDPAIVNALGSHFGTELLAHGEPTGSARVADRLGVASIDTAMSARRRGGAALVLPADCLPSLAALCSIFDSDKIGAATFCIVPGKNISEAVLARLPCATHPMQQLAHPALPMPQPRWEPGSSAQQPGRQAGLPSAIRTMNEIVWQMDALMPLSPDLALPGRSKHVHPPKLYVYVIHTATQAQLDLCLLAIGAQSGVDIGGVTVISSQSNVVPSFGIEFPIRFQTQGEETDTGLGSPAHNDIIVRLDTAIFPHDPRTFLALANLCRTDRIGAASCAVSISIPEKGMNEVVQVPWALDCEPHPPGSTGQAIARFFPAATFTAPAIDPRIVALRAEIWRELQTTDIATELVNLCRSKQLQMVCTTVVRVAGTDVDPFVEAAPTFLDAFETNSAGESAIYLSRLLP